jgi:phage repressor protein C with HTH and peptisase S24 domain
MDLKEIIEKIKNSDVTAYEIAKNTLLTEVGINKILNGTSLNPRKSTLKMLEDYITTYVDKSEVRTKQISIDKKQEEESSNTKNKQPKNNQARLIDVPNNIMYVPLVNQYAYGGYLSGFDDPVFIEELPKIPFIAEKEHKGKYICFEVKGDSMDDGTHESILERDILLCRNVRKDFWQSKLHINKWDFVIIHKDNGICVKRITNHDVENGIITLHSLNDYYEDFDVHLKDVSKIFNIVDIQRKKSRR